MDAKGTVLPSGVIYIEKGTIVGVRGASEARPAGFERAKVHALDATIFPGLIELHNHLAYNILPSWDVPKKFANRDAWGGSAAYQALVTNPMSVIGRTPDLLPAVVRYVECKCLVAGVTTSQGIALFSNKGAGRYYRGIVRNVEQTDEAALPEAMTRIADVDASDAARFKERLQRPNCMLLHLSEGIDQAAREHFLALRISKEDWAINPNLAGIHCAGCHAEDLKRMQRLGGTMIWSPFSNLLLYGATAKVEIARDCGLRMGLGSDWSVTGSKNLLGELKVARLVSRSLGGVFSDEDLVAMVTRNAAGVLHWQDVLGTLEAGKRADLVAIRGVDAKPYASLLEALENDIELVMIHGVPRCGTPKVMSDFDATHERVSIGGEPRALNLKQETADPVVGKITFRAARDTMTDALERLPDLAKKLEAPRMAGPARVEDPLVWSLALDEIQPTGMEIRPRLAAPGATVRSTGPRLKLRRTADPLSKRVKPTRLDPLTVAEDPSFLDWVRTQENVPEEIREGLVAAYSRRS